MLITRRLNTNCLDENIKDTQQYISIQKYCDAWKDTEQKVEIF